MKCQYCKKSFEPDRRGQACCSYVCALNYSRGKIKKEKKIKDKEVKERLKTKSQYLKELQLIFNKYIRLRDAGLPCISCGVTITGKGHASHYYSVGAYPNLRFNEDNVHMSCEKCNVHLHGNIADYSERLPDKIGSERFKQLMSSKNEPAHLSIPEIEDLKKVYKEKIKDLDN